MSLVWTEPPIRASATLFINISDSACSACNVRADPCERRHRGPSGDGCGANFTAVSSNYTGLDWRVQKMRPDLPFLDPEVAEKNIKASKRRIPTEKTTR